MSRDSKILLAIKLHQNRLKIEWEISEKYAIQVNLTAGIGFLLPISSFFGSSLGSWSECWILHEKVSYEYRRAFLSHTAVSSLYSLTVPQLLPRVVVREYWSLRILRQPKGLANSTNKHTMCLTNSHYSWKKHKKKHKNYFLWCTYIKTTSRSPRSFKNLNLDNLSRDLNNVPWHIVETIDNVEDLWLMWKSLFWDIVNTHDHGHVPLKTFRAEKKKNIIFNEEVT